MQQRFLLFYHSCTVSDNKMFDTEFLTLVRVHSQALYVHGLAVDYTKSVRTGMVWIFVTIHKRPMCAVD